jgi:hypothetical protein
MPTPWACDQIPFYITTSSSYRVLVIFIDFVSVRLANIHFFFFSGCKWWYDVKGKQIHQLFVYWEGQLGGGGYLATHQGKMQR